MKNEKGSITLFTLIAMIFLLTIAFTAYASSMAKLQVQNAELDQIKANYEKEINAESLANLYNELTGTRGWLPGEGTAQNPYKIYKIEDLVEFSNRSNRAENPDNFAGKYVELMNDVDFNDVRCYENAERIDFGDVNGNGTVEGLRTELTTGAGWKSIGYGVEFSGTMNGNSHEIKNIYINKSITAVQYIGLFAYIINADIENLGVSGKITNTNGNTTVGAIAGRSRGTTTVKNSYSKVEISNISGTWDSGGIIGDGYNAMTIEGCYNEGKIIGSEYSGGIIGYISENTKFDIGNCSNKGDIIEASKGGGIVGCALTHQLSFIKDSINSGKVTNKKSNAGGIISVVNGNVEIIRSYNKGEVESIKYAGGIVSTNNSQGNIKISNSYNLGKVSSEYTVGGIMGQNLGDVIIANTYNEGNITSEEINSSIGSISIGGIIGKSIENGNCKIINCINRADLLSNTNYKVEIDIGGIAGWIINGVINQCGNTGKIINGTRNGGILGTAWQSANVENVSTVSIINSFNSGEINAIINSEIPAYTGGIASYACRSNLNIINTYNTGNINSYSYSAGIISYCITNSNVKISNCFNTGNITNTTSRVAGIFSELNSGCTATIDTSYYKNNVSIGAYDITPDPSTQMTESQMKASSFITTLNTNKNSINLDDYGLSDYTLSSWKTGTDGYPAFDW